MNQIKRIRQQLELTQPSLAQRLNVTTRTIANWEKYPDHELPKRLSGETLSLLMELQQQIRKPLPTQIILSVK